MTAYDKNGFRILFHFAKECPPGRPDVLVVVVSMLNTAPLPVKSIVLQAAVPKVSASLILNLLFWPPFSGQQVAVGLSQTPGPFPSKELLFYLQSMKVKLQPPSGTELSPFSPIQPPAAITQVMLLANPLKVSMGDSTIPTWSCCPN